jgi:hypothetical protein
MTSSAWDTLATACADMIRVAILNSTMLRVIRMKLSKRIDNKTGIQSSISAQEKCYVTTFDKEAICHRANQSRQENKRCEAELSPEFPSVMYEKLLITEETCLETC